MRPLSWVDCGQIKKRLYLDVSSVCASCYFMKEFQDCPRKHRQCAETLFKHLYKRLPSNVWELGSSVPLLHSGSELSTCCCYSFHLRWRYFAQTCLVLITTWCTSECLQTLHYFTLVDLAWAKNLIVIDVKGCVKCISSVFIPLNQINRLPD